MRHHRAVRRLAAVTVLLYALAVLVGSTHLRDAVAQSLDLGIPLPVPEGALLVAAATALLVAGASRGLLRGQRPVYLVVVFAMGLSAVAHLLRGVDSSSAVLSLVVVGFLLVEKESFRARVSVRSVVVRLSVLAVVALALTATAILLSLGFLTAAHHQTGLDLEAVLEGESLAWPLKVVVVIGLLIVATAVGWALTAPDERVPANTTDDLESARTLVRQFGGDSLSYFALRDDKTHLVVGDGLVSYAVVDGYCLVAPDPIGPGRGTAWVTLRAFAVRQGWPVVVAAVSRANAERLRAEGMTVVYTGDEAVVDARGFRLDGHDRKSIRQAVNRMRRNGYTTEVLQSRELSDGDREEVRAVASVTRRGSVERGFSMALGRIADPDDDVVLVLVRDPDARVCAFCQFVPSRALRGWSLDAMRRDGQPHPNGLMELALVDFFDWVTSSGGAKVSLNFAPFRAVLDGTPRARPLMGLDRWLLQRVSRSTQMTSLYRFNAKFDPEWVPRYAAVDSPEYVIPGALAWLRAEGISELPLVARLAFRLRT